jgi:glutamate-5-semialdehyde dehydrogenase
MSSATEVVAARGRAAAHAAPSLAGADDATVNAVLLAMATGLGERERELVEANSADVEAATSGGMPASMVDRLRMGTDRLSAAADQLRGLAAVPFPAVTRELGDLPGGLRLAERRRPVGVIGANYEARPVVTADIASQLVKSRNAGVLRTGAAALRSSRALLGHVICPALERCGLDPSAIQLIDVAHHDAALALVEQPGLIPLVILRGSGPTTRDLARRAAQHGVRTLAHADGGGVLYIDGAADAPAALELIEAGLDRLGVCNRLNLLLVAEAVWPSLQGRVLALFQRLGVAGSLPPHEHPVGFEWALDEDNEATVTVLPVRGPVEAARVANTETSGLAATIVTSDPDAARRFLDAYEGTTALWNASTRLVDGFKMLGVPETGINVDRLPGPRGPVTFRDLYLRQFVVTPR